MVSTRSKTYDSKKVGINKTKQNNKDKFSIDNQDKYIDSKTWISASKIKNYMIQDPLLDWLQMYYNKETIQKIQTREEYNEKEKKREGKKEKKTERNKGKKEREKIGKKRKMGIKKGEQGNTKKGIEVMKKVVEQIKEKEEEKEEKGNFTEYLMGKGIEFEKEIIEIIKRKIGRENVEQVSYGMKDIMSVDKAKQTIKLMKEGKPVIYQGVLHDISRKRYGSPDILIRSDWINKIVKNKTISKDLNERAIRLNTKYHYRVIDIKYMTLQLKANGYNILNSDLYPYYKGQVFYYTELLGRIQGYMPLDGYLLGRGNTYKRRKQTYYEPNSLSRLGHINIIMDKKQYDNMEKAVKWIMDLRNEGYNWSLYPAPSRYELYPNMCNHRDGIYHNIKKQIAENIDEITLIWQCGSKNRQKAFEHGITKWTDPNCNTDILGINGPKQKRIVQRMLDFNRNVIGKEKIIIPSFISNNDNNWQNPSQIEFFIDFEFINNVFDDFSQLPSINSLSLIFLIGVGYFDPSSNKWLYKSFLSQNLSLSEEKRILSDFISFIDSFNLSSPLLYHWSSAESVFFNQALSRYSSLSFSSNPIFFDFLKVFKSEAILVKGVFSFSLKDIYSSLSLSGLLPPSPSTFCHNGADAMYNAWSYYKNPSSSHIINDICRYNEHDCFIIYQIVRYLRLHHI